VTRTDISVMRNFECRTQMRYGMRHTLAGSYRETVVGSK